VTGKQRVMYEVGVGQNVLAVVADPAALIRWGVTVVGCGPKAGDGQSREASHLVGSKSLGRAQIEGRRSPAGWGIGTIDEGGEHGQEKADALARRRACRDDDM